MNNICVFMPRGRLDATSAPLLRERLTAGDTIDGRIVLDFSSVDFMDSSGLGTLVASARRLRAQQGDLKLACLADKVRRVFELTRADRLFDIYDDPEAAVSSFAPEKSA
ncbi:MAG: STAS domain-containing protein [Desulfobacterales bacterium]|nr:STAS domain-containing protein [Desulfobacterales bacterium]